MSSAAYAARGSGRAHRPGSAFAAAHGPMAPSWISPHGLRADVMALAHDLHRFRAHLDRGPDLRLRGGLAVQRDPHPRASSRTARRINLVMN